MNIATIAFASLIAMSNGGHWHQAQGRVPLWVRANGGEWHVVSWCEPAKCRVTGDAVIYSMALRKTVSDWRSFCWWVPVLVPCQEKKITLTS